MQNILQKIPTPDLERFLDTSQTLTFCCSMVTLLRPSLESDSEHLPALLLTVLCSGIGMYRQLSKERIIIDTITGITTVGLLVASHFMFSIQDQENMCVFVIFFTSLFESFRSEEAQFTRMEDEEPTDAQPDREIKEIKEDGLPFDKVTEQLNEIMKTVKDGFPFDKITEQLNDIMETVDEWETVLRFEALVDQISANQQGNFARRVNVGRGPGNTNTMGVIR